MCWWWGWWKLSGESGRKLSGESESFLVKVYESYLVKVYESYLMKVDESHQVKVDENYIWCESGGSGWKLHLVRIRWTWMKVISDANQVECRNERAALIGPGMKERQKGMRDYFRFCQKYISPQKNRIGVQMEIFSVSRKPWLVSRLWGTRGAKPPNLSTIPAKTGDHHIESGNDDQNDEKVLQCRGSFLKYGTKLKVFCGSQD